MSGPGYIHGTSPSEQDRLSRLNRLCNPPFLEFLNLSEGERALEVGSGLGILTAEAADSAPQSFVAGVEYSVDQLRERREHPRAAFCRGDAHALPFRSGVFDTVYCRFLLEHVSDPLRVLHEMRRVLREGGRALAQENNIRVHEFDPPCPAFDRVWGRFAELQSRLGGDALIGRRLYRLFLSAGFRSVELSIQPQVHWSGEPGFADWVENLIGNIRSGESALMRERLATEAEIAEAVAELKALKAREDASAIFYWNRAAGLR